MIAQVPQYLFPYAFLLWCPLICPAARLLMRFHSYTYRREAMNSRSLCLALPGSVWVSGHMQTSEQLWLQYRPARNSRRFSRLFREKPEFYGENPIAKRFG
ncbi:MAG: hypothetical protein U0L10_13280, partial [Lachnospiraceae bacterium]|nr:hypothetical protein [Lachnospiraceae bacterium]